MPLPVAPPKLGIPPSHFFAKAGRRAYLRAGRRLSCYAMDPQPPLAPHPPPFEDGAESALGRYRHYLLLLARVQIGPGRGRDVDASDVVQQALMNAHDNRAQFRGQTEAERVAWLRRI